MCTSYHLSETAGHDAWACDSGEASVQAKKGRRGLSGQNAPRTDAPLGRVDPASELVGQIYVDDDGEVFDVMLNLVDVATNHDKYFILQVRPTCTRAHLTNLRPVHPDTTKLCVLILACWKTGRDRTPQLFRKSTEQPLARARCAQRLYTLCVIPC